MKKDDTTLQELASHKKSKYVNKQNTNKLLKLLLTSHRQWSFNELSDKLNTPIEHITALISELAGQGKSILFSNSMVGILTEPISTPSKIISNGASTLHRFGVTADNHLASNTHVWMC